MKFTYHKIYVFKVYKWEYESRERGMSPVDIEVQEMSECTGEWVYMDYPDIVCRREEEL